VLFLLRGLSVVEEVDAEGMAMEETVEARLLLRLWGLGEIDAATAGSEVEGGVGGG
jgi:hypothetical protein